MLSLATTGNLRRWATQTLPLSATTGPLSARTAGHSIDQASLSRSPRLPVIFCRFRHASQAVKNQRKQLGQEGEYLKNADIEDRSLTFSGRKPLGGRESRGARESFGGQEYTGGRSFGGRESRGARESFGGQEYTRGRSFGGREFRNTRESFGGQEYTGKGRVGGSKRTFGGQEYSGGWENTAIHNAIERLNKPQSLRLHLESIGMSTDNARQLIKQFSAKVIQDEVAEVNKKAIGALAEDALEVGMTFKSMGTSREAAIAGKLDRVLWDAFFTHCEGMFPPDVEFRLARMRSIADLRYPAEWNSKSRMMKRKIIMHVGPTNSGKTYSALMRLKEADRGAYLSPLRLLAHEIFETMNSAGVPCNLVTGEERRYGVSDANGVPQPGAARVVSSTIEMANFEREVDVAIIDEIQMLADAERGWAWTHALLGLPAREIHLCGEPTVVELVKKICATVDEEVEVKHYDRLSKLEMQSESLYGNLRHIQKGDCLVTFSRSSIFRAKQAIEAETGLRCAVAYGSLPPESRNSQAKLFNDPTSGYDVLVASDAIGMGLNLNIRRIIFEAVEKFDGKAVRVLSLTQLKQIAGRAGRFGTEYAVGQATTLVQEDMATLKRALAIPMIEIKRAGIQPTPQMIEEFAMLLPNAPFSYVLKTFEMMSRNSSLFFPSQFRTMVQNAEIMDNIKMPVRERIPFISAPIQIRDAALVLEAVKMAKAVAAGLAAPIDNFVKLPEEGSKKEKKLELQRLESNHRTIMLYLWLSQRFPNVFEGGFESEATKRKKRCEKLIEMALEQADSRRSEKARRRLEEQTAEQEAQPEVDTTLSVATAQGGYQHSQY